MATLVPALIENPVEGSHVGRGLDRKTNSLLPCGLITEEAYGEMTDIPLLPIETLISQKLSTYRSFIHKASDSNSRNALRKDLTQWHFGQIA